MLEKHTDNFPSDAVQTVLGDPDFAAEQFKIFRDRVEARSGIIVRHFVVDLSLVGMAAIEATGRAKYVNADMVASMPGATAPEGKLHFFQPGYYTTAEKVEAEYSKRSLVAVDPTTLCAFNAANPEFADTYPNGTRWKNADRDFCCVCFYRRDGERRVAVYPFGPAWFGDYWLAGVGK